MEANSVIRPQKIFDLLKEERYRYEDPRDKNVNSVFLRSFVCVHRNSEILTYRLGRYRDDRDTFMFRRSIGFSTLVHLEEHTLFNLGNFGILDAGLRAAKFDLDVPEDVTDEGTNASLAYFIWSSCGTETNDLLAVIKFECPTWFEPIKRRLALNDLSWMDATMPVNDFDDYDPWSKSVLINHFGVKVGLDVENPTTAFGSA